MTWIVINVAAELINENMAEKIANTNFSKIDKDSDGFMKLTVNILLRHGKFVLIKHLLDFSSEDDSLNLSQDVINGSRTILGKVLHEIHIRGRSLTTLTKFCLLLNPYLPCYR